MALYATAIVCLRCLQWLWWRGTFRVPCRIDVTASISHHTFINFSDVGI